jgi:hypothetical protein
MPFSSILAEARFHLLHDLEAVGHRRRADLHGARAERQELRRVAPGRDAADAGDRQAMRLGSRAISATMLSAMGFTAGPQ